jgi:hypothetical protein
MLASGVVLLGGGSGIKGPFSGRAAHMGKCVYCNQSAGFFGDRHTGCEKKADKALSDLQKTIHTHLRGDPVLLPPPLPPSNSGITFPAEEVRKVIHSVLSEALEYAKQGRVYSEQTERRIFDTIASTGLDMEAVMSSPEAQELMEWGVLRDLDRGVVPQRVNIDGLGLILRKGEIAIWRFDNVRFYQHRTHKQWVGRSGGYSIRIMKGFWIRESEHGGRQITYETNDHIGTGSLVITNKHLYLITGTASVRVDYSKLISVVPFSDGVGIHIDRQRNAQYSIGNLIGFHADFAYVVIKYFSEAQAR